MGNVRSFIYVVSFHSTFCVFVNSPNTPDAFNQQDASETDLGNIRVSSRKPADRTDSMVDATRIFYVEVREVRREPSSWGKGV